MTWPAKTLRPFCAFAAALAFLLAAATWSVAADHPGAEIYRQRCASCHGAEGQGTREYDEPLVGDRPLSALASYITEKMPEDEPEKCVGEEARQVADYIYNAFYSPLAQARNRPPRIELARLTARQFYCSVADLVGSFRETGQWDEQRGLQADYFNSGRRIRDNSRVAQRVDANIEFDFGNSGPKVDKIEKKEYAIRWQGGVLVGDTGDYEFVLDTKNGARLWVNDNEVALVDAWVRSGKQTEYRQTIRLLGGRVYPLRVEFFKSKQDSDAAIALKWKPPRGRLQTIPKRCLSPHRFGEKLVLQTDFPPDDRSLGYARGTDVSKQWDEATTYAALEVAAYAHSQLHRLAGVRSESPDRQQRLQDFCVRFAERAFRRPLSEPQRQFFIERQFAAADSPDEAVKRVVLLTLKSPRFLYRDIDPAETDGHALASRIAFALWDSLPDEPLREAAANGQLQTRDQVAAQIQRMLPDLRTQAKMREFFHQWLELDRLEELSKDADQFPDFNAAIAADLRVSLDMFLHDVMWSEASDFRQLLLAEPMYLNGPLAKLYGAQLPADAPFQKVELTEQPRAGALSHPLLLAGFAYHSTSSPIHRGVFVARNMLGRTLLPPPDAFTPLSPKQHPDLTTRQRIALQTGAKACQSCHAMINPLGFSLEEFDAIGRYRTKEEGRPIDPSGHYNALDGKTIQFKGAKELAAFLAGSQESHLAFVERLFHYTMKQPIRAYGTDMNENLRKSFAGQDFHMQKLLAELVTGAALHKP